MQTAEYTFDDGDTKRIPAAYDIKQYMISLGNELNEGRDLKEMFTDNTVLKNQIYENVRRYNHLKESGDGCPLCDGDRKKIDSSLEEYRNKANVDAAEMSKVRQSLADKMMWTANLITDLIYADLSKNG